MLDGDVDDIFCNQAALCKWVIVCVTQTCSRYEKHLVYWLLSVVLRSIKNVMSYIMWIHTLVVSIYSWRNCASGRYDHDQNGAGIDKARLEQRMEAPTIEGVLIRISVECAIIHDNHAYNVLYIHNDTQCICFCMTKGLLFPKWSTCYRPSMRHCAHMILHRTDFCWSSSGVKVQWRTNLNQQT